MRALLGLALMLAAPPVGADASLAAPSASGCSRLPAGWRVAEMVRSALGRKVAAKLIRGQVLTWQIIEDERPLRVEEAVVWLAFDDHRFMLLHVYRHPRERGWYRAWHEAEIDSEIENDPFEGHHVFNSPPTAEERKRFLEATDWGLQVNWRTLGAEVCRGPDSA
jgi:hypothetical protein